MGTVTEIGPEKKGPSCVGGAVECRRTWHACELGKWVRVRLACCPCCRGELCTRHGSGRKSLMGSVCLLSATVVLKVGSSGVREVRRCAPIRSVEHITLSHG